MRGCRLVFGVAVVAVAVAVAAVVAAVVGTAVAVGDINHDGIEDIIIGAPKVSSDHGFGYVIFGSEIVTDINKIFWMSEFCM